MSYCAYGCCPGCLSGDVLNSDSAKVLLVVLSTEVGVVFICCSECLGVVGVVGGVDASRSCAALVVCCSECSSNGSNTLESTGGYSW